MKTSLSAVWDRLRNTPGSRWMWIGVGAGILLIGLAGGAWAWWTQSPPDARWQAVDRMIERAHGPVPTITTDELAERLQRPASEHPVLLDARSPEEYAVSHIAGAHLYDPNNPDTALLDTLSSDQPIAVYCSVGHRSADVVAHLRERGFTRAVNVRGSIFMWANEGREVVRNGTAVTAVHPYDAMWGRLLDEPLRADAPAPYSSGE